MPACFCGSGIQRGLDASSARRNGAYWIHAPKTIVALDADEAQKLAAFITGKPSKALDTAVAREIARRMCRGYRVPARNPRNLSSQQPFGR